MTLLYRYMLKSSAFILAKTAAEQKTRERKKNGLETTNQANDVLLRLTEHNRATQIERGGDVFF